MSTTAAADSDPDTPPIGLREQSRRRTMERIRAAAVKLLSEKGFDQVTTREVAQVAKVGEATLFRYVSSKQELLLLVIGNQMDQHIDELFASDAAMATRPGPRDGAFYVARVMDIYHERAEFYLTDPDTVTGYLRYAFSPGSALGAQNVEQGDRVVDLVDSIIREGQAGGALLATVSASVVAWNCQGIYAHEVLRRQVRGWPAETVWERMRERLEVQLLPLVIDRRQENSPAGASEDIAARADADGHEEVIVAGKPKDGRE